MPARCRPLHVIYDPEWKYDPPSENANYIFAVFLVCWLSVSIYAWYRYRNQKDN